MKILLFIISPLFFVACNDNFKTAKSQSSIANSKIVQVQLADSLGYITFSIPNRYDTTFSWTHHSDCGKPCDIIKYRWQPKTLRVNKESGFMWYEPTDSIEQFTISHSGDFPFHSNIDSGIMFKLHPQIKANAKSQYIVSFDTVQKIGDRYFSIIVVNSYDTLKNKYLKKVFAETSIKGNAIYFNYDLLTTKKDSINDNFIENSKKNLKTIKISNGI